MSTFWQAPVVVVVFVTWFTSPPSGFADIARREALRRQLTSASVKTFTNLDLPPVPMEALVAGATADAAAAAAGAAAAGEEVQPPISLGGEVAVTGQSGTTPPPPPAAATRETAPTPQRTAVTQPAPVEAGSAAPATGRGDEKQWRDRMTTAQQALERDQVLMDAMQSRINALNTDIINRDDPAQQADLRAQLQRAVSEQQRLQKQLEADRKAIDDIRTEARRLGVPPGWVR